ncbi:MAG: ribbon-helix-helix protein, CopG family [Deltaproteobacteria bacterium]|nr:ribbon-helix-helix protein, CopG family [Deltaproteobacteria bacterium]
MKARITTSLPAKLAGAVDRLARQRRRSRSGIIEEGLRLLLGREREAAIDASLDAYYGTLPAAERAEEAAMIRAFHRSQRRIGLDGPRPPRRPRKR